MQLWEIPKTKTTVNTSGQLLKPAKDKSVCINKLNILLKLKPQSQ